MTEKEKLRSQFADLSEECTLCFRERKENSKDTENCHIGCETNKQIQIIRGHIGSTKQEQDTWHKPNAITADQYITHKKNGLTDKKISKLHGISVFTLESRKKKWGLTSGGAKNVV